MLHTLTVVRRNGLAPVEVPVDVPDDLIGHFAEAMKEALAFNRDIDDCLSLALCVADGGVTAVSIPAADVDYVVVRPGGTTLGILRDRFERSAASAGPITVMP